MCTRPGPPAGARWPGPGSLPGCTCPGLPVIDVTAGPFRGVRGGVSTKRAAIAAYAAGRPLLWIDDEFGRLDSVWAEQRLVDERPGLATLLSATHPG
ncbi:hypothetical protein ABZW49_41310, partial [Nonomuraea wenchangensis]